MFDELVHLVQLPISQGFEVLNASYALHVGIVSSYNARNMFMTTYNVHLLLIFPLSDFAFSSLFSYFSLFDCIVWFTGRILAICCSCGNLRVIVCRVVHN